MSLLLTPCWENGDGPWLEMIVIVVKLIVIARHDVRLVVHGGGSLQLVYPLLDVWQLRDINTTNTGGRRESKLS